VEWDGELFVGRIGVDESDVASPLTNEPVPQSLKTTDYFTTGKTG